MKEKMAMEILKESHKAQEILFSLFSKYLCEQIKENNNKDDINGKIYKGIFASYHTIMNSIQNEILKEYPDLEKKFNEYIQNKKLDNKI